MSLVYDHDFKCPEADFRKNQDFMDPYYPNHRQEQLIHTNGSPRHWSTPSNFSDDTFKNGGVNDNCEGGYRPFQPSSPQMDSFFAEVIKTEHKKEAITQQSSNLGMQDSSFGFMNNGGLETRMQAKRVHDSFRGSGLVKQHSSPPGLLSNLMMENEFSFTSDFRDLKNSKDVHGEASSSKKVANNHMDLEHRPQLSRSSIMPHQVSDIGIDFSSDSWDKTSFNVFKGTGGTNITFSGSETQNENSRNRLVHHLSQPITFSEKDTVEKFLHFQETTVPFKVRAKRGFATHPRSIAERVRRNRISQRMKRLQDLFPDMDKQTSTADMLDMAVDHIKELQKQVKDLNESRGKCRCSGKGKA
ncbi:PREDICTED: transcription factor bHLH130-like [Tarenaya hassleriana]|uniref:transcription factor bHLH130-like n=1 Tax=Tarenaya hassleriana TaxID=28532 RepID=UPI00053C6408|nr:PREDICTED: transcription factor bHLH130-like [Tarenaya hassleriana]